MFKYLTLVPCFLTIFIYIWLIRPLPVSWVWRVVAGLVLLLGAVKLQLIPLNSVSVIDLPLFALVLFNWLYTLTFTAGLVGIAYLFVSLILWRVLPVLRRPLVRLAVVGGLGALVSTFGLWQALKVPDVREHRLALPNLPSDLRGLRIALLTDLHVGPLYDEHWTAELVRRVNAEKPDLIAVTGDIVDGSVSMMLPRLAPLADLRAPLGVYYVTGNHEYYSGFRPWMQAVDGLGLRVLENAHVQVPVGNSILSVAGVADPAGNRYTHQPGIPVPSLKAALAGVTLSTNAPNVFTLLLAHQPLYAADNAVSGVDLQLSGHTHGGTVLPLQPLVRDFNNGFISGLYTVGSMRLFVSNGAGVWSGIPLRLGVPSEIALIQLMD